MCTAPHKAIPSTHTALADWTIRNVRGAVGGLLFLDPAKARRYWFGRGAAGETCGKPAASRMTA